MKHSLIITILILFGIGKIYPQPSNDLCNGAIELTPGMYPLDFTNATYSGICDIDCMLTLSSGNLCSRDLWYKVTLADSFWVSLIGNLTFGPLYLEVYSGSCTNLFLEFCGSPQYIRRMAAGTYFFKLGADLVNNSDMTVDICNPPILNPIDDFYACESLTLPPIKGSNLSGNEAYYTVTGGGGTKYLPGDMITANDNLYVFDSNGNLGSCRDEDDFMVDIDFGGSDKEPLGQGGSWFNTFTWGLSQPDNCDNVTIFDNQTVYVPDGLNTARCKTLEVERGGTFTVHFEGKVQMGTN